MCSCKNYPYSPYRSDWNLLEGRGEELCKTKTLKKCMKLKMESLKGWGVHWGCMDISGNYMCTQVSSLIDCQGGLDMKVGRSNS